VHHRGSNGAAGPTVRGVREHGQLAVRDNVERGRRIRIPQGCHPLPTERRQGGGRGPVGAELPEPGVQQVGYVLFRSNPPVSDVVLEKAFGINQKAVQHIRNNLKA
jgi:hypothetical protein